MTEPIAIEYDVELRDGERVNIVAELDPDNLDLLGAPPPHAPEWAGLKRVGCSVCTLDPRVHHHCPVAANLADLVERFTSRFSYEPVKLRVSTAERTVVADTTLQNALSSLTGIYMVTSGCPVLDKLRPMVRFHLPLASLDETVYRATSMYLLGQYMRAQHGLEPDWSLAGLDAIYRQVHQVNLSMARTIRSAAKLDASANALVRLDLFTGGVSFSIREALGNMKFLFEKTYLQDSDEKD